MALRRYVCGTIAAGLVALCTTAAAAHREVEECAGAFCLLLAIVVKPILPNDTKRTAH